MSTIKLVRDEIQLWQALWRQIDAFVERIDEARDADAENRRKFLALIDVVTAIEDEKRVRNGIGLAPPLEIALRRKEPGLKKKDELEEKDADDRHRVPGAYDLEVAIAPINLPLDEQIEEGDLENVRLEPNELTLFHYFDRDDATWKPMRTPSYDFGTFKLAESTEIFPCATEGLFDPEARRLRSLLPPIPPPFDAILQIPQFGPTWSSLKKSRTPPDDPPNLVKAVSQGGAVVVAMLAETLCKQGAESILKAASTLKDDEFPELDDDDFDFIPKLEEAAAALDARAKLYGSVAAGQQPAATVALLGSPISSALESDIAKVLDTVVEERIKTPDGTARILRTIEWSFNGFWWLRLAVLKSREKRLHILLVKRFLRTFVADFVAVCAGKPTALPLQSPLARHAHTTGEHLYLAPGTQGLDKLKPGMLAVVDGDRKALAVVLGSDPTPQDTPRLRVRPLQISMAASSKLPGVAGMITAGKVTPGPIDPALLTAKALRDGAVPGQSPNDGVPQELAALWSRLCLIFGWSYIHQRIKDLRPDFKADFPTHLPRSLRLPVLGPVTPDTNRLVLDVEALRAAGFDLDGPKQPLIARPREMLLLRGADKNGSIWQGAVEVMTITRTTADQVDLEAPSPPPGRPICCQDTGDRVIVQVPSTSLRVPLVSDISLHRDFLGFGTPSLAVGALLPKEVDPDSHRGDTAVYRGPEVKAAQEVLGRWMWTR